MLIWLTFLRAATQMAACELPSGGKLTLTKFYSENCDHCTKIAPHFNEISDKIKENNLNMKIRNVDCNTCDCSALDISAIPTVILSKGKEEIARHRGYTEYKGLVKFLTDNLELDEKIFETTVNSAGKVIQLYERDFYSGFQGPWLILFYSKRKDPLREVFEELAIKYYGKLNVGEMSEGNAVNLLHRFNIQSFPAVIAIYNGILAGYNGTQDLPSVNKFVEKLIAPSFTELTLEKFEEMATKDPKTPKFIVFYSNLGLANSYYRKAAHEYKLRADIYRSSDHQLFQRASIYPRKFEDETAKDEEKVVLAVFKDNIFHRCPVPLSDPHEIAQWLFHAHFPNITRITNDNFYTIFHGIKPAVILLTQGDEFVELLEQAAEKINDGLPFNEQVLAVLDINEFSMFIPSLLPGLKSPAMIVYDPRRQLFFTKGIRFTEQNFYKDLLSLINDYFSEKLTPYPGRASYKKYIIIIGAIASLFALGSYIREKRRQTSSIGKKQ
ncbi:Thioredoxin/protein disulfide isomerase [Pseudoloma neurophilia]|uniref:Thioredoxin/protein disulfide isomerase n=1 Tax=Pseudoloma neurophilia TaxID=146866 RepID=A0A0R0M0T3_9MICR|nr:Thioredoxin/protein disulfide isomerase [Pseudoloma neurophilia]